MKLRAQIDDDPVALMWGENTLRLTPGSHQVKIWVHYWRDYGRAELGMTTRGGGTIQLHYSAPALRLRAGRLGAQRQPRAGVARLWLCLVGASLIFVGALHLLTYVGSHH